MTDSVSTRIFTIFFNFFTIFPIFSEILTLYKACSRLKETIEKLKSENRRVGELHAIKQAECADLESQIDELLTQLSIKEVRSQLVHRRPSCRTEVLFHNLSLQNPKSRYHLRTLHW